jgi:hypothetical protein
MACRTTTPFTVWIRCVIQTHRQGSAFADATAARHSRRKARTCAMKARCSRV